MRLNTNRPGIYSEYTVSSGGEQHKVFKTCALILFIPDCDDVISPGRLIEVRSMEDLGSQFFFRGKLEYLLQDPVRMLLQKGAEKLYVCVANNQEHLNECIASLEFCTDIDIELIYTYDTSVILKMVNHIEKLASSKKERIAVTVASGVQSALDIAKNIVSERLMIVGQKSRLVNSRHDSPMNEFSTAASIACEISLKQDPPQNLNNMSLSCIQQFEGISDREVESCLVGGVTTIESVGDNVRCIKALTTKSRESQKGDTTFENISTTLTVDYVMKSIRKLLDSMLEGAKNNKQTVEKISSQIIILMNELVDKEILSSFDNPNVYFSQHDNGVCIIELKFKVTCAINQICLTAQIIV